MRVHARAESRRRARDAVEKPHRIERAVLLGQECGVEALRLVRREHARERHLVHRKAVRVQQRERGALVLGLLLGAGQAQAAGSPIVAFEAERFDQQADACVRAAADLEHRACARAPP